jgi:hypothetical protein
MFPTFAKTLNGWWLGVHDATYGMKFYRCLYNSHSTSRAAGIACFINWAAATYPGLEVQQAATANLNAMAGVHSEAVATAAWGWVQIRGYNAAVVLRRTGSNSDTAASAGQIMTGVDAQDYVAWKAEVGGDPVYSSYIVRLCTGASAATNTTVAGAAWIHAIM